MLGYDRAKVEAQLAELRQEWAAAERQAVERAEAAERERERQRQERERREQAEAALRQERERRERAEAAERERERRGILARLWNALMGRN